MEHKVESNLLLDFFQGGEMGALINAFDWTRTPLGPITTWPPSLVTTVRLMLNSRYPMFVWWGPELTHIYNDAYIPVLGARHPEALGRSAPEIWSEIWKDVGPQADLVLSEGKGTWNDQTLLIMERFGYTEETYFTFSYSPVPDDEGAVGGVFCACTEETNRVVGERRLTILRQLAAATAEAHSAEDACVIAGNILSEHPKDIAFALLYLLDPGGASATLVAHTGLAPDLAPPVIPVNAGERNGIPWPIDAAIGNRGLVLEDVAGLGLPGGAWPEPASVAVVLPLVKGGQEQATGFLIAGASPRRPFDDSYRGFFDLVTGSIASAVVNARAYEEERRRAESLAELDRAKTVFFSNTSHEFRTPLTLMLGPIASVLANPGLPSSARSELETAHRNGLRLLRLVNSLLDFSRIEAGRIQASFEPADLAALTADLASVFRSAIEQAGVRFEVDCPKLPEPVYVDRDMWEKIVLNLLSNAFKYTLEGTIRVALAAHGDHVELSVSDTGTGIPEAELARVFERFHRVEGAWGRTHEGTGIGLALIQELARLHGGSVRAESTYGQGSTFTVSVPFGSSHVPQDQIGARRTMSSTAVHADSFLEEVQRATNETPPVLAAQPQARFGRVLFADDNADMRDYVSRILGPAYAVETVSDGALALAAALRNPPDLILTDVMMPFLDGIDLIKALRADPRTEAVPVVVVSARAGQESVVEIMDAGADDYIVKPFNARELLARVKAHLAMARLRREAAARLRASHIELANQVADFETVLREIPVGVALATDPECRNIRVNPEFARMLGIQSDWNASKTATESAALPFRILQNGRELAADELPMQRAAREAREIRDFEAEIVRADGSVVHELGHSVPLLDETGTVRGCLAVFVDITARRRIEEAVRESEKRFRQLADSAPVMIWVTTAEGRCTYVNRQWTEFTGSTLEQNLDLGWLDFVHPDERPEAGEAFIDSHGRDSAFRLEYRLRRHDGVWRWTIDSGTPRFSSDGEFLGYVGSVIDITERKEMEQALRASEEQLALAQESAGIASWSWYPKSGDRAFSGQYFELYGLDPEKVPSYEEWLELVHAEDRDRVNAEMMRALQETNTLDMEFRIVRPDGIVRWVAGKGRVFRDATGVPDRFTGVHYDITSRKRAEAQLINANEDLKQFAYAASHDLQEPLRMVTAYTQLLARSYREQLDDEARMLIDTAVEGARRLEQLLRGLREYWQVRETNLVRLETVDLNQAAQKAKLNLHNAIQESGAEIVMGTLPVVLADETPLVQVFQNLFSNAIKYRSRERTPRIEVQARRDRSEWTVSVVDNGMGMDSKYTSQVFGIFKRLHGPEYAGAGIGLAICQKIIERLGGRIWAESTVNQGSTFKFTLPATPPS